jgi:hypothetical protein
MDLVVGVREKELPRSVFQIGAFARLRSIGMRHME